MYASSLTKLKCLWYYTPVFMRHPDGHMTWGGRTREALTVLLVAALVILAPFGPALEIHHALAAADHDGHQHSDNDLCQWVQHHTGQSLLVEAPSLQSTSAPAALLVLPPAGLCSSLLICGELSRGPPRS